MFNRDCYNVQSSLFQDGCNLFISTNTTLFTPKVHLKLLLQLFEIKHKINCLVFVNILVVKKYLLCITYVIFDSRLLLCELQLIFEINFIVIFKSQYEFYSGFDLIEMILLNNLYILN